MSSLLNNLKAFYAMEDTAGASRTDATGNGHTLTDSGTVARAVGKLGAGPYAAGFTAASSQYLTAAASADLAISYVNEGFSLAFWVYPTTSGATKVMAMKGVVGNTATEEWAVYQTTADKALFEIVGVSGFLIGQATSGDAMTINAWNFVWAWYDRANATINIKLNCGSATSAAVSPNTPYIGTGVMLIGRSIDNGTPLYFSGRIDEFGIWQRILTATEACTTIYNSGTGFAYPWDSAPASTSASPQFWMLTSGRKLGRLQASATRDMEVGADATTGTKIPDWVFSTGFDIQPVPYTLTSLLVDASAQVKAKVAKTVLGKTPEEGREFDIVPRQHMDEILVPGSADFRAYKMRVEFSGGNSVTVHRALWERDPVDKAKGG